MYTLLCLFLPSYTLLHTYVREYTFNIIVSIISETINSNNPGIVFKFDQQNSSAYRANLETI